MIRPHNTTVIICAAGMGTRLGIGTTKALVDIDGIPLILRQLELLKDYDDIRIVVGFQAERIINVVKDYRKDIMFVFNYEYETTGVANSLRRGLLGAREYILSIEGDILINPDDFSALAEYDGECLAVTSITSAEPIKASVDTNVVRRLDRSNGNMQWPGIVKIGIEKLKGNSSHVYDVLNECLPLPVIRIRAREIDTPEDYENALDWFENGQVD